MALETLTKLQTVTLSGSQSSVTFTNIPQTYTDLKIVMSVRGSSTNTNYDPIGILVNGSLPSLTYKSFYGNGSAMGSYGSSSDTFTASTAGGTWARLDSIGVQAGATTSNMFSNSELYITNYSGNTTKTFSYNIVTESSGSQAYQVESTGFFTSASGITSISFAGRDGSFVANSTFYLYGVKAQRNVAKAIGGDSVFFDGTYWTHTFISSGIFTPKVPVSCEYAVLGGGGAGGVDYAGGGGAGGWRTTVGTSPLPLTASPYVITVGAGGVGGTRSNGADGGNGSTSTFGSVTSAGGGGGGSYNGTQNGKSGGSGGGGSGGYGGGGQGNGGAGNTPATTPAQGNSGGIGYTVPAYGSNRYGGGGGGATGAGGNANSGAFGQGGTGVTSTITGTSVTYATGGKGCEFQSFGSPVSGSANTGNGGQGGGENVGGGNGGSGIVVIRYLA